MRRLPGHVWACEAAPRRLFARGAHIMQGPLPASATIRLMTEPAKLSGAKPRLYHAPSSYYSMIARLALAEGGIAYEPVFVEIHVRMTQQQPDYVRLNPNMTVPTLVLA